MGPELATSRTERLLTAVEVGHVIVFGIAGAAGDDTALGTVIRPQAVTDGATGATYTPAQLTETAAQGTMTQGTIWTTDELITDPDVVSDLHSRGVVALDMETAAIAAVCERRGLGWSVVRVISDRPADRIVTAEVFGLSKPDGSPDLAAVARYFIRHPWHVRRMTRLAASTRRATAIAADAAIAASNHIR
jgi:nucleoside phosphorylase